MSTAFTSRLAYKEIQEGLVGLQLEVWQAIRDWSELLGPSIQDLAERLKRKEASICGRVAELRASGAIHDGPLKIGKCRVQVKTYSAVVWRAPENLPGQLQLL